MECGAMTEDDRREGFDPALKAQIIDRLYDVALDPVRYEDLVDAWNGQADLSIPAARPSGAFHDAEIENHIERASVFLDRFELSNRVSGYQSALDEIGRSAAFVCDGRTIIAANAAARDVMGLADGAPLATLPFSDGDIAELCAVARRVAAGGAEKAATLRIRPERSGSPVIVRVMPVKGPSEQPFALVVSTALAWPADFDLILNDSFDLTQAEVDIVRGIVDGKGLREIAAERGRSEQTVKTQLRGVLAKTETHSQAELIRITLGLMDLTSARGTPRPPTAVVGRLLPIPFQTMTMPGNRRYDWIEFGAPSGRPCLYLPLDYGLIRWPADIEQEARRRNIRVIVPVRAGYGHSGEMPPRIDYCTETARDQIRLLEHLGVARAAVLCLGADMRFAVRMAGLRPDLVTGILAAAGTLPAVTSAQYERMGKWHRFILANGRYAPKILPFLVKAGYSLARRIGKEQFFRAVNAGSPGDMAAFDDPLVREAMLLGSEISLSSWHTAHLAFSREVIDSERDWSDIVHACPVPILMMQGDEDPQSPRQNIVERAPEFANIELEWLPGCGQLAFFKERWRVLDRLERFLPG